MKSSTRNAAKSARDVSYYRKRYQNRFFAKLVAFINEEAQRDKITKKDMADRLGKDPGQLSRLLNHPSNLTLDTVSDLLLALDAEAEPPEIVRFKDRRAPNFVHPLIAKITGASPAQSNSRFPEQIVGQGNAVQMGGDLSNQPAQLAQTAPGIDAWKFLEAGVA